MGPPRFSAKSRREVANPKSAKRLRCCLESSDRRPVPPCSYFGSGSDYIAAYFSKLGFGESGTFAVGFVDAERMSSGYQFSEVLGTKLPFPDGRFDFIISNHVIKHFAGREQRTHLAEIGRCLRDNGKLYIAVPNRWGLIDAHYRLPSWVGCRGSWPMAICD